MAKVPEGYVALDFIGFTDKGLYSATETYMQNDLVHKDNNVWRCLIDNINGITPVEGGSWTMFIKAPSGVDIATNNSTGIVKGNPNEINIGSDGMMSISSSFTEQKTLSEIVGTESKKTLFGKIAYAIKTLIAHIADNSIHVKEDHTHTSNEVTFDDDKTAQTKVGAIDGITDSLTATSSNVALSAKAGNSLQTQINDVNSNLKSEITSVHYQFDLNANATTETSWSMDITLDGYIPMCWSIRNSWSTSIIVGVEFFDKNKISGFYLNPTKHSIAAHIYVVYRKS